MNLIKIYLKLLYNALFYTEANNHQLRKTVSFILLI